jgi:uncharacterized protein
MITRKLFPIIKNSLNSFPVIGLIGSRQTGKTTLARHILQHRGDSAVYLDLEKPSDCTKLDEPEIYLAQHRDRLVILDEIQRLPHIFPVLRALVDEKRTNGRFFLLGSASPELRRQSAESLAGRIAYHELSPLSLEELGFESPVIQRLWLRGGYPLSYLAPSDQKSLLWREEFVRTYLERDIPQLGIRIPAAVLRRFWQMLSHMHGRIWNASQIASGLGVSPPTARHYLDVLQDTFMVRQVQPYFINIKKRIVKSPKIYLTDTGILHALLHIESMEALLGHPSVGASWEGLVFEQIVRMLPRGWEYYFYRTGGGAEIDLVLLPPPGKAPIAVEIKHTASPAMSRGFREGFADLACSCGYIVYPGAGYYPLAGAVHALPLTQLRRIFQTAP